MIHPINIIKDQLRILNHNFQLKVKKDARTVSHHNWIADQGDKKHRLQYDLDENSTVFDVGGFEGQWAQDIYNRYKCNIYIFEPVPQYIKLMAKRFKKNRAIKINQFGLSDKSTSENLSMTGDTSSVFNQSNANIKAKFVDIVEFMKDHKISKIDLLKLNIEGGEYAVLERLIESGLIKNITDVQVQFHDFIPNAKARMSKIQQELMKTHQITYQYYLVWENWHIKE